MTKAMIDQQEPQDQVASTATLELDVSSNLSKGSDAEPSLPSSQMTHGSRAQEEFKVHEVGPAVEGQRQQLEGRAKTVEQAECRPAFIQNVLDNPPVLPWEDRDQFLQIFQSFEGYYNEHLRRDADYLWLMEAAKAAFELYRLDRMRTAIIILQQRPAMTDVVLEALDVDPDLLPNGLKLREMAHDTARLFYTDPKFRENFTTKLLEGAGFGREAAAGAAFLRALPSLTKLDQLRKLAEKTRDKALKRLDALSVSAASPAYLPATAKAVGVIVQIGGPGGV
jgi:hypothetical protein